MDELWTPIIAVDFDGTISLGQWPDTGEPNTGLIRWLIQQRNKGHKVILHSCRTGKELDDAVRFCRVYGLEFDAINENLPKIIEMYGGDNKKITAYYYIDDRGINVHSYDWEYMALHKLDLPRWEE